MSNNLVLIPGTATAFAATNDTIKQFELGTEGMDVDTGFVYRYVAVPSSGSSAVSAGMLLYVTTTGSFTVSDDYTGGIGLFNSPAGIGTGTIGAGNYGWILVDGEHSAILKKTGALTVNCGYIGSSTNGKAEGLATAGVAITARAFGVVMVSVTAAVTTFKGTVKCR